jgi:hypothetical protein
MKFRHAAALALMGWYLMFPPVPLDTSPEGHVNRFSQKPDTNAPLTKWAIRGKYDRAKDCEQDRSYETDAICVKSDDLRLELN